MLDRAGSSSVTGIFSNADGAGRAGDIAINADGDISVLRGATVSSSTFGTGNAGSIRLSSRNLEIDGFGRASGIIGQAELTSQERQSRQRRGQRGRQLAALAWRRDHDRQFFIR